jgi:hypothetical protein
VKIILRESLSASAIFVIHFLIRIKEQQEGVVTEKPALCHPFVAYQASNKSGNEQLSQTQGN